MPAARERPTRPSRRVPDPPVAAAGAPAEPSPAGDPADAPTAPPRSPGAALGAYAVDELRQAAALLDLPGDARHEGVHQARKSMRRARACLALRERGDRDHAQTARRVAALDAELRALCRGLSAVRDAQALCEALERLAPDVPRPAARRFARIRALARARRAQALARALERDPGFARRRRRLAALAEAVAALGWARLDADALERGLARSRRRVRKARRHVRRHADDDAGWHRYRRRLRRLRQQVVALIAGGLAPPRGRRKLEAAASRLGEAQDDALVLRACRRKGLFDGEQRALLRALARARLQRARR